MPKGTFPVSRCHQPHSCGEPLLTCACTGDPPTLGGRLGSVSCGVAAPFLWVLVHARFCLYPQDWSLCFPQFCGSLVIKSYWPSKSSSLGIPSPFVGSPGCETWCGIPNLHSSVRTSLVLLFSNLWLTHWVWDLILSWLCPSYHLAAASSLSLDVGYLFFIDSSILLWMVA